MMRHAVVIQTDGNAEATLVNTERLGEIVGGWLEAISPTVDTGHMPWTAYLNEEGKIEGLNPNFVATDVATMLGWGGRLSGDFLVGPVVFLGAPDVEGYDTDLPMSIAQAIVDHYRRQGASIEAE